MFSVKYDLFLLKEQIMNIIRGLKGVLAGNPLSTNKNHHVVGQCEVLKNAAGGSQDSFSSACLRKALGLMPILLRKTREK